MGHLLLLSVLLLAATASAPPPSTTSCFDELVSFSPCLPYISSSPNNISDTPPIQCCDNLEAAFENNTAICVCYLVRNPLILGFPINSTKLTSLFSVCPVKEKQQGHHNFSLQSFCSGSTLLPPFRSITDHNSSSSGPRRPSPSASPRLRTPHPGNDDNPSPQVSSGPDSSLPPSDADDKDKPSPAASQFPAVAIFYFFYVLLCLYVATSIH